MHGHSDGRYLPAQRSPATSAKSPMRKSMQHSKISPDIHTGPADIQKALKLHLRKALKSAKRRKRHVFLELFSGKAVLASAIRARQYGCLACDIKYGVEFDLCNPVVRTTIRGWISSRVVSGVWFGTPCSSFSLA
eukprot:7540008-Karenia_brevis.AAC.1